MPTEHIKLKKSKNLAGRHRGTKFRSEKKSKKNNNRAFIKPLSSL